MRESILRWRELEMMYIDVKTFENLINLDFCHSVLCFCQGWDVVGVIYLWKKVKYGNLKKQTFLRIFFPYSTYTSTCLQTINMNKAKVIPKSLSLLDLAFDHLQFALYNILRCIPTYLSNFSCSPVSKLYVNKLVWKWRDQTSEWKNLGHSLIR